MCKRIMSLSLRSRRETNFMRKSGKHLVIKNPLALSEKPFGFLFLTGENKHKERLNGSPH